MRTGKYHKQLKSDYQYKAFIPDNLPFEIKYDYVFQTLLSKADISLGRLDGIAETIPDVDFFILMYIRKEATLSSQIEGTQATFSDVLKAESKIIDSEIHNDVDEIINYIHAMNYGLKRLTDFPLSLPLIKEIHQKLLFGVRGEHKTPGEFRRSQNWVGGSSINTATYIPPPVDEMYESLYNLEKFMHNSTPMPPLVKAGLIHLQFETIHPFLDGNGRIGRLLITFFLCHNGILKKPLLYLSDFFKKHRQIYYDKLNATRDKDEIEEWLKFFLEGITMTSEKAVDTIKKIITLRDKNRDIVLSKLRANKSIMTLLNYLYRNPYITIKQASKITSIEITNATKLIMKFVDIGILKEITGNKRNRVFSYEDYIRLFE
jgi:Fic family protein